MYKNDVIGNVYSFVDVLMILLLWCTSVDVRTFAYGVLISVLNFVHCSLFIHKHLHLMISMFYVCMSLLIFLFLFLYIFF